MEIKSDVYKSLLIFEKKHQKDVNKFMIVDISLYDFDKKKFKEEKLLSRLEALKKEKYAIIIIGFSKRDKKEVLNMKKEENDYEGLLNLFETNVGILIATKGDEFQLPSVGIVDYIYEQNFLGVNENAKGYFCCKIKKNKNKTSHYFCYNSKLSLIDLDYFLKSGEIKNINSNLKFPFTNFIEEKENIYDQFIQAIEKNEKKKICIILIGSPGSGKSYFTTQTKNLENFVRLNNDTIQNVNKMQKIFVENINKGKNIILDNTNPSKEKRCFYIEKARKEGYIVISIFFKFSKEFAMHLNQLRKFSFFKNDISVSVPPIAIHSYFKNLEYPDKKEGFDEIIIIEKFSPKFDNEKKKRYFNYIYF